MSKSLVDPRAGNAAGWLIALLLVIGLFAAGVWAVYTYGEGNIYIGDRTVSELEWWEVAGALAAGVVALIIGLIGGLLGLIVGLFAAVVALAIGALGIFAGLFITTGVLLGPVLLLVLIILMIRRGGKAEAEV
ncbi:MAG: hypothetical protein Tsb0010_12810 [Parvularculaceae bacterium]